MADGPVLRSKPLGGVDRPPQLELELEYIVYHHPCHRLFANVKHRQTASTELQ